MVVKGNLYQRHFLNARMSLLLIAFIPEYNPSILLVTSEGEDLFSPAIRMRTLHTVDWYKIIDICVHI